MTQKMKCSKLLFLKGISKIIRDPFLYVFLEGTNSSLTYSECYLSFVGTMFVFLNWNSLHARLNRHYEAWSYKKKSTKRLKHTGNLFKVQRD